MSSKPAAQQTARAETPAEATATGSETLEEFKESFAYGSRTDLLFKYLKRFSGEETGEFLHELITRLGETIDDGKVERLLEHVYEWNVRAYVEEVSASTPWDYAEGPFAPLSKPLSEVRLGLLTATGSYVEGDDPEPFGVKNMTQEEAIPRIVEFVKAEPQLAAIPWDTPRDKLRVRHPGYDIRAVRADPNVGLPLERLRELANQGVIKETLPDAYSFVGATAQIPLIKKHAPRWAEMLKEKGADAVLLVPL